MKRFLSLNPVAVLYAVNVAVALVVSFGFGLSHNQVAAITVIASAVLTLPAAFTARPVALGAITGAITTGLTAAAAFGLNLSSEQVGYAAAGVSVVVGLFTHQSVIPAAAAKAGKTAHQLILEKPGGFW